jgi:carbon monoxide dehydrogenase subunit G
MSRRGGVSRGLAFAVVLAMGVSPAAMGAADPDVRVYRGAGEIQIDASIRVEAHHHVAWRVLTDYNSLAEFVPGMRSSQIVSEPGEPLVVRQTGSRSPLAPPVEIVVRIVESRLEAIRFQAVGGTLKSKSGEWRIEQAQNATLLSYRASIVPGFWVPPLIGVAVMGEEVRNKLAGVAREIQRRAAVTPVFGCWLAEFDDAKPNP